MSFRSNLDALVQDFVANILGAVRAASLDELLGQRRGRGRPKKVAGGELPVPFRKKVAKVKAARGKGRLPRRSAKQIQNGLAKIIGLLKKNEPMRAEQIQKELKLDRRELPRLVQEGLKSKALKKHGSKRATTYALA